MAWASLTQRNIPRHFSVSDKLFYSPGRSKAGCPKAFAFRSWCLWPVPWGSWLPFQAQPEDKNAGMCQCGYLEWAALPGVAQYLRQAEGLLLLPADPERTEVGPEPAQTEMGSDVSCCSKP